MKINNNFISAVKSKLSETLPGVEVHKKMLPIFPDNDLDYFASDMSLKKAAVLIILFKIDDSIKTILIERTTDKGPHSGQIAFPGGKMDPEDNDLIDTAIREACEEIGVCLSRDNYIGSLTPIQIPISKFSVLPIICEVDKLTEFTISEQEVKKAFIIDLDEVFKSETSKILTVREMNINAPCFVFEDKIIWGATAMVLKELKEIINTLNLNN